MKVVLLALLLRKTNVIFVPANSLLYPACSFKGRVKVKLFDVNVVISVRMRDVCDVQGHNLK